MSAGAGVGRGRGDRTGERAGVGGLRVGSVDDRHAVRRVVVRDPARTGARRPPAHGERSAAGRDHGLRWSARRPGRERAVRGRGGAAVHGRRGDVRRGRRARGDAPASRAPDCRDRCAAAAATARRCRHRRAVARQAAGAATAPRSGRGGQRGDRRADGGAGPVRARCPRRPGGRIRTGPAGRLARRDHRWSAAGRLGVRLGTLPTLRWVLVAQTVALGVLATARHVVPGTAALAVFVAGTAVWNVLANWYLQRVVPTDLLGRVGSANRVRRLSPRVCGAGV